MNYKIQIIDSFSNSQKNLYNAIFKLLKPINETYTQFDMWYSKVFMPGLEKSLRKIIVALDEKSNPVGVALLKNTKEEKKLCCLFVHKDYRGNNIASKLLKESYRLLNTTSPFTTVSEKNFDSTKNIFKEPNFKFSYKKKDVYKKMSGNTIIIMKQQRF